MKTNVMLIACGAAVLGLAALLANPRRGTNRACSFIFGVVALVHFFIFKALQAGEQFFIDGHTLPLSWLRANLAVACAIPVGFWLLLQSILRPDWSRSQVRWKLCAWVVFSIIAVIVTLSDSIIPNTSAPTNNRHTPAYYVLAATIAGALLVIGYQAVHEMRRASGIRKFELKLTVFASGTAAALAFLLNALGNASNIYFFKHAASWVTFVALAMGAWGLTIQRVVDMRDVAMSVGQRLSVIAFLVAGVVLVASILRGSLTWPYDLVVSIGLVAPAAFWLETKSRRWMKLGGAKQLQELRAEVIGLARSEALNEVLANRFEELLSRHFRTAIARLLTRDAEGFIGRDLRLVTGSDAHGAACDFGWATPERLQRMRAKPRTEELRAFIDTNNLGVLVTIPSGNPNPALVVALGTKINESPFTYLEVERLQNVAELMDNILTRSRLDAQAVLRARLEHLGMMSRGLAHDLKNLITPVSSFLVHTEGRYAAETPEGEVHLAAQRSVRIMTDYVREALFFGDRLEPRFQPVALERLFQMAREATMERAKRRSVSLRLECGTSDLIIADAVLLQRMLANLIGNAIDASNTSQAVILRVSGKSAERISLQVEDGGCGISAENLTRIFEPYFTTKQFGDDVRGFGLGLTISQKIARLHAGTISFESRVGHGTIVTIDLPRKQNASKIAPAL